MAPALELRLWRLAAVSVASLAVLLACGGSGDENDDEARSASALSWPSAPSTVLTTTPEPARPGTSAATGPPCLRPPLPAVPQAPFGAEAGRLFEQQATHAALQAAAQSAAVQHRGTLVDRDPFDAHEPGTTR